MNDSFPPGIGNPAQRALASIGVTSVEQCSNFTRTELAALHGMGPKALRIIGETLDEKSLSFKSV